MALTPANTSASLGASDNKAVSGPQEVVGFISDAKRYQSLRFVDQSGSKGIDAVKVNFEGLEGTRFRNIGVQESQFDDFKGIVLEVRQNGFGKDLKISRDY